MAVTVNGRVCNMTVVSVLSSSRRRSRRRRRSRSGSRSSHHVVETCSSLDAHDGALNNLWKIRGLPGTHQPGKRQSRRS